MGHVGETVDYGVCRFEWIGKRIFARFLGIGEAKGFGTNRIGGIWIWEFYLSEGIKYDRNNRFAFYSSRRNPSSFLAFDKRALLNFGWG